MKDGWEKNPLESVTTVFADGDWVESKDQSPEGVRLIQTGNVGEGTFKNRDHKARYISEETFKRLRCTEIVEGDCLISRLPDPVGRSCILPFSPEKMITAVDCTIVRFDKTRVIPEFFNFYSQSLTYLAEVESETSGTTRKRISRSKLAEVRVPVPPLPEQQRIVSILDEAFEGIATAKENAEKNLQNARALFESYLETAISTSGENWAKKSLEELLELGWIEGHLDGNHGGEYPRKEEFVGSGVPYISANCIVEDEVDISRCKFLSSERGNRFRKGVAVDGDVLFAHNATVGPVAILHTSEERVILGTSLTYYRCNPTFVLAEYLAHFMRSTAFTNQYLQIMRQSTRNQIPITKQREFFHTIPPVDVQRKLVSVLDGLFETTRELESIYQQKLKALDDLKKSLLDQAFSGNL